MRSTVIAILAVLSLSTSAMRDTSAIAVADPTTVTWKGVEWGVFGSGTAVVDGSGNLLLTPDSDEAFGLHVNALPGNINSKQTPWVEAAWFDTGDAAHLIDVLVYDNTPSYIPAFGFGSKWTGAQVAFNRYGDTPAERSDPAFQEYPFFSSYQGFGPGGVPVYTADRASGVAHKALVGRLKTGSLFYRFDDVWRRSDNLIGEYKGSPIAYVFGDVYVQVRGAAGETITFTDFRFGDSFREIWIRPNFFSEPFNLPVATAEKAGASAWYPDRRAPESFALVSDPSSALANTLEINVDETGSVAPDYYATQGRKYNLWNPIDTFITADLFIPADWATSGTQRYGGLWGTTLDADSVISGFPILAFSAGEGFMFFTQDVDQNPDNGYSPDYVQLGFPEDFAYDKWYTLRIALVDGAFKAFVDDNLLYTDTVTFDSSQFHSMMLEIYNFDGTDYSTNWDNVGAGPLRTFTVDPSDPDAFATIQAAVDACEGGDTVLVAPGTYPEIVNVNKSITLASIDGPATTILDGAMQLPFNGILLEGLTIVPKDGDMVAATKAGVYISAWGKGSTIAGCVFDGPGTASGYSGIVTRYGGQNNNLRLDGNEFFEWTSGVYLNPSSGHYMKNNTFHDNTAGIGSDGISYVKVRGNTFLNNVEGWGVSSAGLGLKASSNVFDGNGTGLAHYSGEVLDGRYNWWGDGTGPSGGATDPVTGIVANGLGDPVSENVRFDPFFNTNPDIMISDPVAGTAWMRGSIHTITWESVGITNNVGLYYRIDGGEWRCIVWNQPNTGEYVWHVNSDVPSDRVTLLVRNVAAWWERHETDEFTLFTNGMSMVAPLGGETLTRGTPFTIEWDRGSISENVGIYYSVDGAPWQVLYWDYPNSGSFVWDLDVDAPASNVTILIRSVKDWRDRVISAPFSIEAGHLPLEFIAPSAGDTLQRNVAYDITWSPDPIVSNVGLFYSINGAPWQIIRWDVPNSGTYSWPVAVATSAGDKVKLLVRSVADWRDRAESGEFEIVD